MAALIAVTQLVLNTTFKSYSTSATLQVLMAVHVPSSLQAIALFRNDNHYFNFRCTFTDSFLSYLKVPYRTLLRTTKIRPQISRNLHCFPGLTKVFRCRRRALVLFASQDGCGGEGSGEVKGDTVCSAV